MKRLYACGDSWTQGDELAPKNSVDPRSIRYYNSWPWLLAQNLNIPVCVNDAQGGGSNLRIFRRTTDYVLRWIGKGNNPKDLQICVGWTTPERSEIGEGAAIYPIQIQKHLQFHKIPCDEHGLKKYQKAYYEIYSDSYHELMTAMYMANLRVFCRGVGVEYYDFIAIGKSPQYWQDLVSEKWNIDLSNMYLQNTWHAEVHNNDWSLHPGKHPTKETHQLWADLLAREIQ
jgi:hypothetical protein